MFFSTFARNVGSKFFFHKSFGKEIFSLDTVVRGVKCGADADKFCATHEGN